MCIRDRIDIIGAIPIIINLKQAGQKIEPFKTVLFSAIILIGFLFFGEWLLSFLSINIQSFAAAGAIILFLLAFEMIFGYEIFRNDAPGGANSLVPLVFPLIAGAASFTTLLSFRASYALVNIIIATLLNLVVVYFVLKRLDIVERLIGQGGIFVLRKFFGVILMAMSVKFFTENISYLVGLIK
ncbi:MarC family protein [uncultured Porphyromonas sp.]|uniref:MarC family protein n=1 Tax=uncultured Porphyromonas sp. TaxID=159274 RepID=UPI002617FDF9|nr:MarC family protein [uncultured Porphyromonas sp.]